MAELQIPESAKKHQSKYKPDSWKDYTIKELGMWIHLLEKRSTHRVNYADAEKDLESARVYLDMMQSHLDAAMMQLKENGDG